MNLDQILKELSTANELPRAALEAAIAQRDEVTPVFLEILEDFVAGGARDESQYELVFFIVHLLGEFRETRSFRPLMDLLRFDPITLEKVLGDATTEDLPKLVISLYDGEFARLKAVIDDSEADEFVRWSLMTAFGYLAWEGRIDREEAAAYLAACYRDLRPRTTNSVWTGWQEAIAILALRDLVPLVEKAFRRCLIDPSHLGFKDFKEDLDLALKGARPEQLKIGSPVGHFHDTVETLSKWQWGAREDFPEFDLGFSDVLETPKSNPWRHVGRNDPCPCGSGKKFKKCCLNTAGSGHLTLN